MDDGPKMFDRSFARAVMVNAVSALVIAGMFYLLVGVFGFRFPRGSRVPLGSAT